MQRSFACAIAAVMVFSVGCSSKPRPLPEKPAATDSASRLHARSAVPVTAAAPPTPPSSSGEKATRIDLLNGCEVSERQVEACAARGSDCKLDPVPHEDHCANRGARCLDSEAPKQGGECRCYCGAERHKAFESLNPPPESSCKTLVNLATGKTEEICEPPELPR